MKLCDTCIYRNNVEQLKPCVVYRDDCEYYESEEDMSEVGVEIVKTEETKESGIKYLNINVSNSEVERNPDRVRLCADAGILEYVKPKTDYKAFAEWVAREIFDDMWEYNNDAFAEIACRKLAKLGIVRAKDDEWELVEPQESDNCNQFSQG